MPYLNCWNCPFGHDFSEFIIILQSVKIFRALTGKNRSNGQHIIDPFSNSVTRFPFAGDSVDSIGWIQSITTFPQDARGVYSVGPMTLAPGDTQEVVAAIIMAQGDDRLKSITTLRLYSDLTREFFDNNYTLYKIEEPISSPKPVPQQFNLTQNFPNPFNPKTVITYSLPQFDTPYLVVLRIYNMLGIEIATLVNQYKPGGTYSIEWNAGNQLSGIYFYRLSIAGLVETKKMTLLK